VGLKFTFTKVGAYLIIRQILGVLKILNFDPPILEIGPTKKGIIHR